METLSKKNKFAAKANQRNKKMIFLPDVYHHIIDTVGYYRPECGGILLGYRSDFVVRKFVFDRNGKTSGGSYDPDITYLNKVVKNEWEKNKLELLGFVHSHPRGVERLSGDWGDGIGDLGYIKRIFDAMPALEKFLVPIIFSESDGKVLQIFPYIAHRKDPSAYETAELEISEVENVIPTSMSVDDFTPVYDKLQGAVDVKLLKDAHVVCIGVGGANGICENLVRTGLGNLTALDFDVVDANNLITQGYYADEVGKLKIDALKERLLKINPTLHYDGINTDFNRIGDEELKKLVKSADILLMMTDDFNAQAKGNRLALKYKKPAVFAMMYEKAKCSEIVFTIPGVTPACFRCAVSSRYKAYENGYTNDVTSTGSTIFHTQHLNSAIGLLTLAILHRNTEGFEFSNWFGNKWERNLIQLRTHPKYSTEEGRLFNRIFGTIPQIVTFDSVWQKIEPDGESAEHGPCPDCGGLGDLSLPSRIIHLFGNLKFKSKTAWLENIVI